MDFRERRRIFIEKLSNPKYNSLDTGTKYMGRIVVTIMGPMFLLVVILLNALRNDVSWAVTVAVVGLVASILFIIYNAIVMNRIKRVINNRLQGMIDKFLRRQNQPEDDYSSCYYFRIVDNTDPTGAELDNMVFSAVELNEAKIACLNWARHSLGIPELGGQWIEMDLGFHLLHGNISIELLTELSHIDIPFEDSPIPFTPAPLGTRPSIRV